MYRIFCESYQNFCKSFENSSTQDEFRYKIAKVFELIVDLNKFQQERERNSDLYKNLCDLLWFMQQNIDKYPKFKAFLWTLESREIVPKYFGTTPQNILEEQAKLANMFLSLLYWE
ncbi:hypothetical protein Calkr_0070 [Caldicellulosiruptor acetigenus I77R1B]|uniref:Uncharacterized protein n=1 Tax=Caldicellulosiruptor acetigenus (strain ATCC 700853 / DSM 12137 / I77R1B) TaxID=632335 RepID=E4S5I6_CALA7|nr:hypothetical protein [Caldicellulosiruptor acetigenus]ADQ39647.1 hypothetical protein Calkr_0070 [Caldicellulosiruptor acetigenus I77R1B]